MRNKKFSRRSFLISSVVGASSLVLNDIESNVIKRLLIY